MTLRCIPKYAKHEQTSTATVEELRKNHAKFLQNYRHMCCMWVLSADTFAVLVSDVAMPGVVAKESPSETGRVRPLMDLCQKLDPKCGSIEGDNFVQLREKLLLRDPSSPKLVARVNQAEAEFLRLATGVRIDDSSAILGSFGARHSRRRFRGDAQVHSKVYLALEDLHNHSGGVAQEPRQALAELPPRASHVGA